jgi:hypothetical protein
MKHDCPYRELEKLPVWKVLSRGIKNLEANGDIEEKTARHYIVGYLAKLLVESDMINETPTEGSSHVGNSLNHSS